MQNIEVELKYRVLDTKGAVEKLDSIAVIGKKGDYQKDDYYTPIHRDFIKQKPIVEWLRVRETPAKNTINYKKWHNKQGYETVSGDEIETLIGDSQQLREIFERLDFKKLISVEKSRSTWNYKDVEIVIDEVTGLGTFIELETKGDFNSLEDAKNHLYEIVKELNLSLGQQDFKGYPHLLLEQQGLA